MAVALDILNNPPSQPYRYGLFSVAAVYDDAGFDPRGGDYTWRVQGCTPGAEWAYCWQSAAAGQAPKNVPRDGWLEASPFVAYDGVRCQRVGESDLGPVAEQRLALSEQGQAERHFWRELGDEAFQNADRMFGGSILTPDTPAATVSEGVAILEAQMAAVTGAVGVIHMPRYAASRYTADRNTLHDGRQLRTELGTPIVAGGGYDYSGPITGTEEFDVLWLYATGPVTVRRGAVQVYGGDQEGFDRASNEVWHLAERPYLITRDCPLYAVAVAAPDRPDTVWPTMPARFQMSVDDSDPLNVTASFTGASCDEVRLSWGDGTDTVGVPVTDGAGSAAHNYETGLPPVAQTRTRAKRAQAAPAKNRKAR
ncbi:hypothetical protein ACIRLA_46455 [Streptomyces sp. NPDC102364]|uniref:hypothetical protein n=1 Tax=Streptomyces sp. NPDC102364 TaxID=3366161 RepID=UPI00382FC8E5